MPHSRPYRETRSYLRNVSGSYLEERIGVITPRKPCLAKQSADPLLSMPETHQSCPSCGRVQDPVGLPPRDLTYSLRNRRGSCGCHDGSLSAAARRRLGQTATRGRYVRQSTQLQYYPQSRAGLRDEYQRVPHLSTRSRTLSIHPPDDANRETMLASS
jgi:hypothetical protein